MFRFIKELKSTILNNSPLKEAIIFSTDTKELFLDIDNSRVKICDVINIDTLSNLDNILAPISNKLYYVEENNCLYKYIDGSWSVIGGKESNITEDDITSIVDGMDI